jgi:hypothetical protein
MVTRTKNPHRGRSRASSITRLAGRLRRRPVAGGQEEDGRRREVAPNECALACVFVDRARKEIEQIKIRLDRMQQWTRAGEKSKQTNLIASPRAWRDWELAKGAWCVCVCDCVAARGPGGLVGVPYSWREGREDA